jgi:RNA polymerase sigma-70 factor, ECF subfamily
MPAPAIHRIKNRFLNKLTPCLFPPFKTYFTQERLSQQEAVPGCSGNQPEPVADEVLMLTYAKTGRPDVFETLYRRYRRQVFGYFVHGTKNRELAEELFQELFMRVIKHAGTYKSKATFRTWLFTIARNLLRDSYRRSGVRRIMTSLDIPKEDTHKSIPEPAAAESQNPFRSAQSSEIRTILSQALADLPHEQREIFLLREMAGLDFTQAAKAASCSVNTAKSRMRYALLRLRDVFSSHGILPER